MRIIKLANNRVIDEFLRTKTPLKDSQLEDTIVVLQAMDQMPSPSGPTVKGIASDMDVLTFFTTSSSVPPVKDVPLCIQYILALNDLYNKGDRNTQQVFGAWHYLLYHTAAASSKLRIVTPAALTAVTMADIATIANTGNYGTLTTQYPMFDALLKKISQSIATAATSTGNTALAGAVAGSGLLDPDKIHAGTSGNVGKPQPSMYRVSQELVGDIMRKRSNIKYVEQNFEIIKETIMKKFAIFGADSRQQEEEIAKQRRDEEIKRRDPALLDPSKPLPAIPAKSLEETFKFNAGDKQWTNPFFLTTIHIFFTVYYQELSKLPRT